MSHEIRTPLNAILGFVNLLIEQDLPKQHRKYLDIILNSGENLLSIINDILDFSKLRSGEFTIEPKIFSIHNEISHTLELFVASANSKDITITSFIDPKIPKELYADSLRINQVLSNFLSNAIKFTDVGGHISVEATCSDSILKISVHDNGIGISENDLKNIFSAFTQAEQGNIENLEGTGLGLSICSQLAEHMNGRVSAESKLGEGSTFCFEVPIEIHNNACQIFSDIDELKELKIVFYLRDEQDNYKAESFLKYSEIFKMNIDVVYDLDSDYDIALFLDDNIDDKIKNYILNSNKKYISLTSKPDDIYEKYRHITSISFPIYCSKIKTAFDELLNYDSFTPHKHKGSIKFNGHILIAEDNEANQELIKIILSKYGLSYDLAVNGKEAVKLYKKNHYDLILMDEQMPIMDGNEAVLNILKYERENELRHTPISALTANVIKGAKERGLSSGFDSFLGKPIVIEELERVFYNYLKKQDEELEEVNIPIENNIIKGLDYNLLSQELMLNQDEILMLVKLFIKKMKKQLPKLQEAIKKKDYENIALISHSIKGSSGNFRMEDLQNITSEMEQKAKAKDDSFDYAATYQNVSQIVGSIEIV
jgi:CheY-like chemotaxis protein